MQSSRALIRMTLYPATTPSLSYPLYPLPFPAFAPARVFPLVFHDVLHITHTRIASSLYIPRVCDHHLRCKAARNDCTVARRQSSSPRVNAGLCWDVRCWQSCIDNCSSGLPSAKTHSAWLIPPVYLTLPIVPRRTVRKNNWRVR